MLKNHLLKKLILIIMFFFIFVAPVLFLALKSFSFAWTWPLSFPKEFTFRAWKLVLQDPYILQSLKTTLIIGGVVVVLNFLIAFPAAYALSRYSFKGKTFIEVVLLTPILIPALAIAMGLHLTMIKLGLSDNILGVALIHLLPTLPYSIRMLKYGLTRLKIGFGEQAATLGANKAVIFLTITLPLLLPSIRSTALLVFVISLSQYALTAIIGGGNVITLPMIYYPFFNSADEAVISSFSVIFALLPICFLLLFEGISKMYLFFIKKP